MIRILRQWQSCSNTVVPVLYYFGDWASSWEISRHSVGVLWFLQVRAGGARSQLSQMPNRHLLPGETMETQREDNWVFNSCWGTTVQGLKGSHRFPWSVGMNSHSLSPTPCVLFAVPGLQAKAWKVWQEWGPGQLSPSPLHFCAGPGAQVLPDSLNTSDCARGTWSGTKTPL